MASVTAAELAALRERVAPGSVSLATPAKDVETMGNSAAAKNHATTSYMSTAVESVQSRWHSRRMLDATSARNPTCNSTGDLQLKLFPCCLEGLSGLDSHPLVQHREFLRVTWTAPNGTTGSFETLTSSLNGPPFLAPTVDPITREATNTVPLVPACAQVSISVIDFPPLPPPAMDAPLPPPAAPSTRPDDSPLWTSQTLWGVKSLDYPVWNTSAALEGPDGEGYFEVPVCTAPFYHGCRVSAHPEAQCIMPAAYCTGTIDPDTGNWTDPPSLSAVAPAVTTMTPQILATRASQAPNRTAIIVGSTLGFIVICFSVAAIVLLAVRLRRARRSRSLRISENLSAMTKHDGCSTAAPDRSTSSFEDLTAFGIFFPRNQHSTHERSDSGFLSVPSRNKHSIDYLVDTGSFESPPGTEAAGKSFDERMSKGQKTPTLHSSKPMDQCPVSPAPLPPSRIPPVDFTPLRRNAKKSLQDMHTSGEFLEVRARLTEQRRILNARTGPPSLIPRIATDRVPAESRFTLQKSAFTSDAEESRVVSDSLSLGRSAVDLNELLASDIVAARSARCPWSAYDTDTKSLSEVSILKSLRQIQHGFPVGLESHEDAESWTKVQLLEQINEIIARKERFAGRYMLTGEYADGGQGLVFFGTMAGTNVSGGKPLDVAIKFPLNKQGFMNEVRLSSLPHFKVHLPELIEVRTNTGGLLAPNGKQLPVFMVLPRGEPLDDFMQRQKPGALHCVLILMFLAEKLAAMHSAGLVHRDVKPANSIFLPLQHTWTLIDYGCAAQTGAECSIMMTPRYGAPELVLGISEGRRTIVVSPAVDVWALGVMAYELLSDNEAFASLPPHEYWMRLEGKGLLPWEENMDGCLKMGKPFAKVIEAMLSRDPLARPTMEDVLDGWKKAINMRAE